MLTVEKGETGGVRRGQARCEQCEHREKADLKQAGMIDMTGEADGTRDRPEIFIWLHKQMFPKL